MGIASAFSLLRADMTNYQFRATIFLSLLFSLQACIENDTSDGPYVYEEEGQREVFWICEGKVEQQMVDLGTPKTIRSCGMKATLRKTEQKEDRTIEYKGDFKIAAVSDVHGQFELFITLLRNNGIIDKGDNWNFGNGHFVITGDIFDRGPKVTEALWFLYNLEQQAEKAGGKVHFLLGNHEVMILNGDLRYLHPKYTKVAKITKRNYESLFAKNTVLGSWLRHRSLLVKINGILFVHGGFHPEIVTTKLSIADINRLFKQHLIKRELKNPREGMAKYLYGDKGPIWYRGYFREPGATMEEIQQLLRFFGVSHIVVGHTTQEKIRTAYDGKVIAVDAGMKSGDYGEVMLWDSGKFTRGTLSGEVFNL